jgi:hypothetical protein
LSQKIGFTVPNQLITSSPTFSLPKTIVFTDGFLNAEMIDILVQFGSHWSEWRVGLGVHSHARVWRYLERTWPQILELAMDPLT